MQNILGTEVNEFVTNRQNSKIQFLQAENAQLQEDIKDLEQALRLNKEALKLSYEQRKQTNQNFSHSTTLGQSNTVDVESQNKLFDKLYQENKQLFDTLQRVTLQRNQAQSKVLIQEQVNEEAVSFQKDIIQELEEKILELRRIIHDKEYAIQELEKMKPQQERDIAIKIREIITPNEQTIKLYGEIENNKYLIKKLSEENQKIKERSDKLKAFNRVIKRDVIKIKVALKNPICFSKMKEFILNDKLDHGDEDLLINKEFIKEFYEEKDDWNEQQNQMMYNKNFYQNPNIKSKAQLIDDISKLQMTVRNFKVLFHREVQSNGILIKQIDELQKFNTQLCETNQTLIDSHKPTQERSEKMKQEIDYYKQYYQKYMDMIRNRRRNNSSANVDKPSSALPQSSSSSNNNLPPISYKHGYSPSLPMNFAVSSPRQQPMISEAQEHEEMTARTYKTDRRDLSSQSNNNVNNQYLQPLVSPSYAQQQQQRVLLFMQQQKNPTTTDQTNANNNISNNMQQQDYDLGFAYPSTARPFQPNNSNNLAMSSNNLMQTQANYNNNNILQDLNMNDSKNDIDEEPSEEMSLKQCQNYLLNLAKDFYENGNVKQNQKQIGITKFIKDKLQGAQQFKVGANCITRAKRSLSDPLDYIFQEDPAVVKQKQEEEKRLLEEKKKIEDPLRLFSVDMSIITGGISNNNNNIKQLKNQLAKNKIVLEPNASFISSENDVGF